VAQVWSHDVHDCPDRHHSKGNLWSRIDWLTTSFGLHHPKQSFSSVQITHILNIFRIDFHHYHFNFRFRFISLHLHRLPIITLLTSYTPSHILFHSATKFSKHDLWSWIFRSNSWWIPQIHPHLHLYIYRLYRPLFITSLFHDSPFSSQFTFRLIRLRSTINTFIYDTLTNHTFLLLMPATYIAPCHSVSLLWNSTVPVATVPNHDHMHSSSTADASHVTYSGRHEITRRVLGPAWFHFVSSSSIWISVS